MRPESYDLVVIGGGPAGISGANTASIFGKRVALVEKLREIGGAGINTGTIPSKTLRETALALSGVRSRKLFGVDLFPKLLFASCLLALCVPRSPIAGAISGC